MINAVLNKTISTYNNTAKEYFEKSQKYAPVPEREKFMSLVQKGGNILDAGCGPGRDSNYFAQHGFTVTGIDLSDGLLSIAKEHAVPGTSFTVMDLRKMTITRKSFHGIWACASLLHLTHAEVPTVLSEFHTLLHTGGTLFVMVKEGSGERMVRGGTVGNDERFFAYYTLGELSELVTHAGFLVTEAYTWNQRDRNSERPSEIWIALFARAT